VWLTEAAELEIQGGAPGFKTGKYTEAWPLRRTLQSWICEASWALPTWATSKGGGNLGVAKLRLRKVICSAKPCVSGFGGSILHPDCFLQMDIQARVGPG